MKVNIAPHPTRDGWYYLDYRPEGKKGKRERIAIEGYENAATEKVRIETAYSRHVAEEVLYPTIRTVVDEYLEWVKLNQAPDTYRCKVNAFKQLTPHFGPFRVQELTQGTYDEFARKLAGKKRAVIAYQHYLAGLIKWMVKRGMAQPLGFRPEQPAYHRPTKIIPHITDIDRVIAEVSDETKKMLLTTMLLTGIRWNECINIRWEDVDLKRETFRMRESETEAEALIDIPHEVLEWMQREWENRKKAKKPAQWVFANKRTGKPFDNIRKALKSACAAVGVKMTPHIFRHASATYLYEATGDIYEVQHHLRHKDVRTSQIYAQYSTARRKKAGGKLSKHLNELRGGGQGDKKKQKD